MPEGDTIHRTADRLRPVLAGRPVVRFEARRLTGPRPRPGATVTGVEAVGKHLLVVFDGALVVETHLGMTGSWHLYETRTRWRKPPRRARLVIEVAGWMAVCFDPPVLRSFPAREQWLAYLGPDLTSAGVDLDAAAARFELVAGTVEVGVALLDQRIACGVGNVYKSEVLFAERVNPFVPVAAIDAATRLLLVTTAHRLLRANLGVGPRRTTPGGLAVYGRRRRPCRVCASPIEARPQGDHRRMTFWCPRCQADPRRSLSR